MTEQKFESKFHKQYVGGEGEIEEKPIVITRPSTEYHQVNLDELLAEYRKYVNDPTAELPVAILEDLKKTGSI